MANENESVGVKVDKQLVFLRRLVKSMGVVLIGGTVLVMALAINRLVDASGKNGLSASCQHVVTDHGKEISGTILAIYQDKHALVLALKEAKKQKIVWIDPCSGKVIRSIYLTK